MGVRVLHDRYDGHAVLYCSVTDWAFGPVFLSDDDGDKTASDNAALFLTWLDNKYPNRDVRKFSDRELEPEYYKWLAEKTENEGRSKVK